MGFCDYLSYSVACYILGCSITSLKQKIYSDLCNLLSLEKSHHELASVMIFPEVRRSEHCSYSISSCITNLLRMNRMNNSDTKDRSKSPIYRNMKKQTSLFISSSPIPMTLQTLRSHSRCRRNSSLSETHRTPTSTTTTTINSPHTSVTYTVPIHFTLIPSST